MKFIYLLKTGFRDPYENMAIDEALMEFVCLLYTSPSPRD